MTPPLASSRPSGTLYRIGRAPDAWAWPDWAFAGEDGTFGNRYDDPEGDYRVLYASSQRVGAFVEVLARYRTDPALVAEYAEIAVDDGDEYPTIPPGLVPADWPAHRCIGTATHPGPFADVGHSDSLAHLRVAMAPRLLHYGLDDLDAGDLRRRAPGAFTGDLPLRLRARGRSRRRTAGRGEIPVTTRRRGRELGDLRRLRTGKLGQRADCHRRRRLRRRTREARSPAGPLSRSTVLARSAP